jgi:hypothetical protein
MEAVPFFRTRGVVLYPGDLTLRDWPERARRAELTTVALHDGAAPSRVARFVQSEEGQSFLERCKQLGLEVEYELHAMLELLPRTLFEKDPALFRMNEEGERTPDANLCVHAEQALEIVVENAVAIGRALRPTTGRYFLWGDDGRAWCRCPRCQGLSDSDQALLLANRLLSALRREDPNAQVAHLAYLNTLWPPTQVRPEPGVFLEYAPIRRRHDMPYAGQHAPEIADPLEALDANLDIFDRASAQALEYWLDVSRFSHWKRLTTQIPWDRAVFAADLDAYGGRGLRHVTTFAAHLDADYVAAFGEPPLEEYGAELRNWKPAERTRNRKGEETL